MTAGHWNGPTRRYDLVKEGSIALLVVTLATVVLAALFSSPDEKTISLRNWAQNAPDDFYATVVSELSGASTSAGYGPPYNTATEGQSIGPVPLARWGGVTTAVDPAQQFVIAPLSTLSDATVKAAVTQWTGASEDQRSAWAGDYAKALEDAGSADKVVAGDYGPVPALAKAELDMAGNGQLDTALIAGSSFYTSDYTKPLLFLGDGSYLEETAGTQHLLGEQWGMMNSTGNFPGQAWLWLATFWYQMPGFNAEGNTWGDNADAIVFGAIMPILSLLLLLVPFIPGLRSVPRWIPLYRLIWRRWYRQQRVTPAG